MLRGLSSAPEHLRQVVTAIRDLVRGVRLSITRSFLDVLDSKHLVCMLNSIWLRLLMFLKIQGLGLTCRQGIIIHCKLPCRWLTQYWAFRVWRAQMVWLTAKQNALTTGAEQARMGHIDCFPGNLSWKWIPEPWSATGGILHPPLFSSSSYRSWWGSQKHSWTLYLRVVFHYNRCLGLIEYIIQTVSR